jgi:putative ABC transport system ATP-binding protein
MNIKFNNVTKSFIQGSKEIQVLKGLTFDLQQQGLFAIVGKSGSGKSTFLSLLCGLDRPTSGEVILDGTIISHLGEKELTDFRSRNIGIIFQNFHLIDNFTALENILLPLEVLKDPNAKTKAYEILDMVGLKDRMNHFPSELSGGECQRVAIARASVTNPKVLLADEPSGNLDPETGEKVMGILFETARKLGQTLILVTHDHELANKCDAVYEIKNHSLDKL